jgi:hypothetical protein
MKTFIRVVEVWVPDSEGHLLEFGGGLYGAARAFGAVSRQMCFGRGEGLPGRVWEAGHPIILKQLQGGYFQRAAAAEAARLACAVAFPVFFADKFKAVVVFFCGDEAEHRGAIELWCNDPDIAADMQLVDGYYGSTGSDFEAASRETSVPRGVGLPGLAWQRQASVFIDGLSQSSTFVRAEHAAAAELQRGLAIPCPMSTHAHKDEHRDEPVDEFKDKQYVLTFLSAAATPIARRIESWGPDADGRSLERSYGYCETAGRLPTGKEQLTSGRGEDTIAEAFATGVPRIRQHAGDEPGAIGQSAAAAGLGGMLALPIANRGVVVETVTLYF